MSSLMMRCLCSERRERERVSDEESKGGEGRGVALQVLKERSVYSSLLLALLAERCLNEIEQINAEAEHVESQFYE
jgi:hypothetical protein